jgi:hypothetical protein
MVAVHEITSSSGGGGSSAKKRRRQQAKALMKVVNKWTTLAIGAGRTAVAWGFMPFVLWVGFNTEPRPS